MTKKNNIHTVDNRRAIEEIRENMAHLQRALNEATTPETSCKFSRVDMHLFCINENNVHLEALLDSHAEKVQRAEDKFDRLWESADPLLPEEKLALNVARIEKRNALVHIIRRLRERWDVDLRSAKSKTDKVMVDRDQYEAFKRWDTKHNQSRASSCTQTEDLIGYAKAFLYAPRGSEESGYEEKE